MAHGSKSSDPIGYQGKASSCAAPGRPVPGIVVELLTFAAE